VQGFWLAFIPLFVAVDAVGVVPIFLGLAEGVDEAARRRLVADATLAAGAVGVGFIFLGDAVLRFLGVTVGDFQVAGGVVLLVLSIYDLLHPMSPLRQSGAGLGVVPLGVPLIVGPAVLTTLLTVTRTHGFLVTLSAFVLNLAIVWAALRWASLVGRLLGDAGARAVAKVFALLLAAIGVTFIRRGLLAAFASR
jgi:multiple antibiotic resistance protein